uniref:Organic solvent tolerance-like N-terminal domain-containing protein n=1 Tax=Candidatus Aschnera chinzeii TaxID=1485666 RepID=A0AAT9G5D1_9ENTR|nr:MAG: hypothetical protein ACHINZ_5790 [Candidatus Aschnera chinzeii]
MPIKFHQFQNNNIFISIYSNKVFYEINKQIIIFTDNVRLQKNNIHITSDKIIFSVANKKLHAYSNNKNTTITSIIPIN